MCPLCYVVVTTNSPCWRACSTGPGPGGAVRSPFSPSPVWGKTALLEWAVRRAGPDFRTLGIRGIRQESSLALAGLHRLLGPVADRISCLPECQAGALRRVFDGNGAADPFTLCTAVHALLTATARSGPVLCWIDDVHWLDRASLEAMAFAARRLGDEPVVMLFAAHNEHVTTPERDRLAGIPRLPLPPLDEAASTEVLTDRCPTGVTEDLAAGLTELTGGNPLALVEMAAALTPGQLSGEQPPPETLPPGSRLRAVYRRRFFRLSPDARRLALLAVADDRLDGRTLTRAAEADRLDLRELEAVRAWGLVRVDGDSITVPSPVIRSAVYADAPLAERNTVHELLARVLDDDRQRARRVWHRAALACEANDVLAAELCQAAAEAGAAGRYTDSSRAWQRAATLTRDRDEQATMLLAAATDAWLAGRSRRARSLVRRLAPAARQGPLRGRADLLRGEIELRDGRPAAGRRMLLDAADRLAGHDRRSAVVALAYAGEASCLNGDLRRYLAIAERAAALRGRHEPPETELLFAHFEGMSATYRGRHQEAVEPLRRTVRLADATDDCAAKVWAGMAAQMLGDDQRTHELAGEAVRLSIDADAAVKPWALAYLALADLWLGRHPSAMAHSMECLRLARAAGQENHAIDHLATMALLAALQGDKDTARTSWRPPSAATRGRARGRRWRSSTGGPPAPATPYASRCPTAAMRCWPATTPRGTSTSARRCGCTSAATRRSRWRARSCCTGTGCAGGASRERPASTCATPCRSSSTTRRSTGPRTRAPSCARRGRPPRRRCTRAPRTSPRSSARSPGWPPRAPPTGRSRRGCSSATAPSTTTCGTSSYGSASAPALSWRGSSAEPGDW
ncbi:hypothetical protein GCM10023191_039020 [Actinoallomurus oryzae]|uniref:Orc1-like AAA ATPase domain-containing protein n=1 Tax=Actinoallomurus oryzae TaxID=502180 RepID=A0ABP8Q5L9_9ACTN